VKRARVFVESYPAGRAWVYEVFETTAPEDNQVSATGIRRSWGEALEAARAWLVQLSDPPG